MNLRDLKNKKILILGFGKEGKDTFKFLRKLFPNKVLGVGDKDNRVKNKELEIKKVRWHLGENYLKKLKDYDIIIKSPGIPIHLPEIEKAFKEGKIMSQTSIFLENCKGLVIGITGSKGKGTTSLLIYKILKKAFKRVYLMGNIGKPALSFLPKIKKNDLVVYELSSHQLYRIKKSPQIAILLNIYPAHLDYFRNFKEYINAKTNITRYQKKSDILFYNSKDKIIRKIVRKTKAKKIPFLIKIPPTIRKLLKVKLSDLNLSAALTLSKFFKIKNDDLFEALSNFRNQPHRLEWVGQFKGIKFYNDSASTIPESTIFAIETFKKDIQTIILGGFENNLSFKTLAKVISRSKIRNLIFFPTTGQKIWEEILKIKKKKNFNSFFVKNMSEAVKIAYFKTQKGKICLLSPASQSFGLFKNYQERGNLFKKYIKKYQKIFEGK